MHSYPSAIKDQLRVARTIDYVTDLINDIQVLGIKDPKNEMENWLLQVEQYLSGCINRRQPVFPDMNTVRHYYANAFYSGMVGGDIKASKTLELQRIRVDDIFMTKLFEGMTRHDSKCHAGIKLKFPGSLCTNDTLDALATALLNPKLPHNVSIDLSDSEHFTDAGVKKLIASLNDDTCYACVKIKLDTPRGFINPDLLKELQDACQRSENRYEQHVADQAKHKKKPPRKDDKHPVVKKTASSEHLVKKDKTDKPKKKSLGGMFSRKSKSTKAAKAEPTEHKRRNSK